MTWLAVRSLLGRVPLVVWAFVAVLGWGALQRHTAKAEAQARAVAEQAAAVQAAAASEQAKARAKEQAWNTATLEAADAYRSHLAVAQRSAAVARTERDRLLDAVASAPGASAAGPRASAPGGVDAAAGLRVVVRECSAALSQVAEAADACDARLTGLQDYVRATRP